MEVKQLPKREELPENLTWDLTKIFSSDQEFDEKYLELSEELKQSEKHKGTLDQGASQFLNAIEFVLRVYRQTEVIYVMRTLKTIKTLEIQITKRFMQEQAVCFRKLVKPFPGLNQKYCNCQMTRFGNISKKNQNWKSIAIISSK